MKIIKANTYRTSVLMALPVLGSLTPSQADLALTRRMVEAGRIMGIPVIDHIIVAGGSGLHTSIKETNPDCFRFSFDKAKGMVTEERERVSVKDRIAEKKQIVTRSNKKELVKQDKNTR